MHFLYQIITSAYIYSLYEEEGYVFLHVLNLRTKESSDIFEVTKILNTLNEDNEVSEDDAIEVKDILTTFWFSDC